MRWPRETVLLDGGHRADALCPTIVSASRATDIPGFYTPWLLARLKAGYSEWRNPFNASQSDIVSFSQTRLFVFWSKYPKPLIPHLGEFDRRGIHYYFQFTLNDYAAEGLEPHLPPLAQRIDAFRELADRVGPRKVIWRFDPLLLAGDITPGQLADKVDRLAEQLRGHTAQLVISFADIAGYAKVRRNMAAAQIHSREFTLDTMRETAAALQERNRRWGLHISTCAEAIDLSGYGISHNKCVDDNLIAELFPEDRSLMAFIGRDNDLFGEQRRARDLKDPGQRTECGCIPSKDIGAYNTCAFGCTYCYATSSPATAAANAKKHRPENPSVSLSHSAS